MKSLILAGGNGTRLWPLSREKNPKQFLKLTDKSLFQDTFLRCLEISDVEEIFVVTNKEQRFFVSGQVQELGYELPPENLLIESVGKNTLPAISFGMKTIKDRYGDANVGIFSSDHILDTSAMDVIASAEELAKNNLVTFAIMPTSPHTGYGYIKPAESLGIGYKVSDFREKPDKETAIKYIEDGCLWNSGMFLFNTEIFFEELKKYAPDVYKLFSDIEDIDIVFKNVQSISVDYGIMEHSDKVAVVKLTQKWSDLGNFAAIYEEFDKKGNCNSINDSDSVCINSERNLVRSKSGKIVSLIDINDMIVVDTPDAILVCPRDSSQKVKDVVNELKARDDERVKLGQTVYRPWGSYTVLDNRDNHIIKNITVLPERKLSLQMHYHRSEHWVVVKGMACVQVNDKKFFVRPGESTFIRAGEKHRLSNPSKIPLEIIEVQLGEYVDEDDIVRFDDEYGRK
ncbi:mannose-1-phosphate guanylyltransferase/mannose-6-phosphate isomerase [Methanolobus sp. WCC1]|uniref:mannose-1-phosphate guanylyltransferase/mannose-6-phosphate isomerase n=1 Tax=unclassified Methanolobus TaxID=2629569 RepID=UPI00325063BE